MQTIILVQVPSAIFVPANLFFAIALADHIAKVDASSEIKIILCHDQSKQEGQKFQTQLQGNIDRVTSVIPSLKGIEHVGPILPFLQEKTYSEPVEIILLLWNHSFNSLLNEPKVTVISEQLKDFANTTYKLATMPDGWVGTIWDIDKFETLTSKLNLTSLYLTTFKGAEVVKSRRDDFQAVVVHGDQSHVKALFLYLGDFSSKIFESAIQSTKRLLAGHILVVTLRPWFTSSFHGGKYDFCFRNLDQKSSYSQFLKVICNYISKQEKTPFSSIILKSDERVKSLLGQNSELFLEDCSDSVSVNYFHNLFDNPDKLESMPFDFIVPELIKTAKLTFYVYDSNTLIPLILSGFSFVAYLGIPEEVIEELEISSDSLDYITMHINRVAHIANIHGYSTEVSNCFARISK